MRTLEKYGKKEIWTQWNTILNGARYFKGYPLRPNTDNPFMIKYKTRKGRLERITDLDTMNYINGLIDYLDKKDLRIYDTENPEYFIDGLVYNKEKDRIEIVFEQEDLKMENKQNKRPFESKGSKMDLRK